MGATATGPGRLASRTPERSTWTPTARATAAWTWTPSGGRCSTPSGRCFTEATRGPPRRGPRWTQNGTHGPRPAGKAMNEDQAALSGFSGLARLFPLPNLVLFPHVVQGLHVFEPRYR